jgi:alpha-galactosidase
MDHSAERIIEVTRPKVVLVGGGSYGWSPTLIKDLLLKAGLEQVDYCLLDINLEAAEMLRAYGEKANGKFGTDCRFTATTDEDEAFDGAGYVVITISTGGLEAMRHDLQIPESYRIYHTVGDTCGPGGWARAVRNIPVFVEMARKIERLSPEAVVLNYTNPLAVLTGAVCRTTGLRTVGLCHGLFGNYRVLQSMFGLESEEQIRCRSAGVNHFFWMLDLAIDGRPGYPQLRERMAGRSLAQFISDLCTDGALSHADTRVASELLDQIGYLTYLGDRHTSEFLPQYLTGTEENLERYKLVRTSVRERMDRAAARKQWIQDVLDGREALPDTPSRETAADIIHSFVNGREFVDVINVPNVGQIENLDPGIVVETLGVVNALGFTPLSVGPLPDKVLDLTLPHARNQVSTLEGMLNQDREQVYEALIHDPLCSHLTYPERLQMGRELLEANHDLVPAFMLA